MENSKSKFRRTILAAGLCVALCTVLGCSSDDDDADVEPCDLTCENGGEKKIIEDKCYCICPLGFTGPNCEIESDCPPSAECPIGHFANPANDCKCEKI
jgi:hypothetical protein